MSVSPTNGIGPVRYKVKVKSLYLTSVVPSVTKLVSMEADGAPFTPHNMLFLTVVACEIGRNGYFAGTDQRTGSGCLVEIMGNLSYK